IFQPFYRGASGIRNGQSGSGLGLSISKQFVELHDGQMSVESVVGVGSTFRFSLPISPFTPPAIKPSAFIKEDWSWLERTSHPKLPNEPLRARVMICDDTGDLLPVLTRYSDEIEFVDCPNIARLQQEIQDCPAQAVILNVPSAQELYARVEQLRQATPDTPIIGCSLPPKSEHAWQAGAVDYLLKPVMRSDLENALAKIGKPVRRVLLVDDNADARQLFTRMLYACDNTLEITTAMTGAQALEELRAHPPDLVLLDIVLPDLDGWQVLAAKNQDENLRDIPVIFLSAQDPAERPMTSRVLMATLGEGIAINKLLRCSQALATLLAQPDQALDRAPG
ncbi:MAG: response regulator, partial [Chloroflexota bacterium]